MKFLIPLAAVLLILIVAGCFSPASRPTPRPRPAAIMPPPPLARSLARTAPARWITNRVILQWTASSSPEAVGTILYWGPAPGQYDQTKTNGLETAAEVVLIRQRGQTFYFALKAFAAAGEQSAFSNEAQFPKAPPRLVSVTITGRDLYRSPDLIHWTRLNADTVTETNAAPAAYFKSAYGLTTIKAIYE